MLNEQEVRAWIVSYLADILDRPENDFHPDQPFESYGLDSADAVVMSGALEEQFDIEIDATLFLRNPDLNALMADLRNAGLVA